MLGENLNIMGKMYIPSGVSKNDDLAGKSAKFTVNYMLIICSNTLKLLSKLTKLKPESASELY
jgi:hypothetical protein